MLVVKVVSPLSSRESFTVLGEDDVPVAPVERYLKYLTDIERSPNTIKAYAHDLKDWFTFLGGRGLDWQSVSLEDIGAFVVWLRLPTALRQGGIAVLPSVEHHCGESTVNRKLSALAAFYLHAVRDGIDVGELLTTWQIGGSRGGWKPFLHHISKHMPSPRRTVSLKAPKKLPRVLTPGEVQTLLDACDRLRDRFLLALLYDAGMRIGEALGLRHSDIAAAERQVTVCRRDNDNRARAKSLTARIVPVSAELIRLYADYLHAEYGDLDSDYVFDAGPAGPAHGRCSLRIPPRRIGVRRGRRRIRRRVLPRHRLRTQRPRPWSVSRSPPAMGQRGPPRPRRVHCLDRSALAQTSPQPGMSGRRLRLRVGSRRIVSAACATVGTRRAAAPGLVVT